MVRDVVCPREQWLANASAGDKNQRRGARGDSPMKATLYQAPLDQTRKCRRAEVVDTRSDLRLARSLPRPSPDASERSWWRRQRQQGHGQGFARWAKTKTRARTAMATRARIATTMGTQATKRHSSKPIAFTVRSGVTSAQSDEHDWLSRKLEQMLEAKNPREKVKVSSRRIGELPKSLKWRSLRRVGVLRR